MGSSLGTRKTLSGACRIHNTFHAYTLVSETIQIRIQSGRTAGMQEEDVGPFLEISLSYKVDKAGHRLAGINRVKQNAFGPGKKFYGFNHCVRRKGITEIGRAHV